MKVYDYKKKIQKIKNTSWNALQSYHQHRKCLKSYSMKCISEACRNLLRALTAPYWMWKRNINQFINMDYEITYSMRRLENGYALSKPRIFWFNHIDWLKNTALKIYDWKQRHDPYNPSHHPANISNNTKCRKYWNEKGLCFVWNWKSFYQFPVTLRPSGGWHVSKACIEIRWVIRLRNGICNVHMP